MIKKLKIRIFNILEGRDPEDRPARLFQVFIMSLIILNVLAMILETVQQIWLRYKLYFHIFDVFSVMVFTLEYMLRIWTCPLNKRYKHPIKGRMRFILTPLALVDLLAILPFYLPMIFPFDLKFIRVIRLLRFFRLFKMARYSDAVVTLVNVLKAKKEELGITIFVVFTLLILSSSLMYFIEHSVQPKAFSSIPASMWWGVSTLTTVGYGDVYPQTPMGKLLGAVIAFLGIGIFALPTGILASGFAEEIQKKHAKEKKRGGICPHCGKRIKQQNNLNF
ncbi:MAG: ion transporter [bacterium]|nr:ion transporter [bacterium]